MRQKLVLFASIFSLNVTISAQAQWVQTTGPSDGDIHSLAVIGANTPSPVLFAGTGGLAHGAVFSTTDSGATWKPTGSNLTGVFVSSLALIDPNSAPPMLFAGTYGGGVFSSSDNGTNWTAGNPGLTGNGLYVQAFAVSGAGSPTPMLFAGTGGAGGVGDGVFRSSDDGASWTAASGGLSSLGLIIRTLMVSGGNTPTPMLLAGTDTGVFLSTDNGGSWTAKSTGLTSNADLAVYGFTEIGANTPTPMLFAGTLGGIFRSTDSGASWTLTSTGLTTNGDQVYTLLATGANSPSPMLFAGTEGGVFLSSDNGAHWTAENTGLTNLFVRALAISGDNLFVGMGGGGAGGGVWRRPLSEMTGSSAVAEHPITRDVAAHAYPNPFPEKTSITFSAPASGAAEITIENLLGNPVAELFDGELHAGPHSITWDASGVAPGSYWCIARMGGRAERIALSVQR